VPQPELQFHVCDLPMLRIAGNGTAAPVAANSSAALKWLPPGNAIKHRKPEGTPIVFDSADTGNVQQSWT
jgi:hypothetical protein